MSDLSDKEKISQVTEIQKEINSLAKNANSNVKKYGEAANDYSDDIYYGIFNSDIYKDTYYKEEMEEKVRNKVSTDANLKAKESLGIINDDSNSDLYKLNTAIDKLEEAGIPLYDYYLSYYAMNDLATGKTKDSKMKAIRENVKTLDKDQLDAIYEIFDIKYKKRS